MTAMKPSPDDILGITFDLDDTLLRDDRTISDYTVSVLRRLSEKGVPIVPASGRAKMSMKPFVDQIGCCPLFIACNGGQVWDARTGELLQQSAFSAELGREIAAFGEEYACYAQTYDDEKFYFNELSDWARKYEASSMLPGELVGPLTAFIREPRIKILMMAEPEKVAAMLSAARERFAGRVSVTCSKPFYLEFNPLEATKGNALRAVSSHLGISLDDVWAFGDSLNDLSMLKAAGHSVAVANAWEDVRLQCDEVCASNQEDGVARCLAEHFLSGEVGA